MSAEPLKRRLFWIDAADAPDSLLRVMNVAAVLQARVRRVEAVVTAAGLGVALETDDHGEDHADQMVRRMQACTQVRRVSFGWSQTA